MNEEGIYTQGYSDDLTILIRGKFESTLGDRLRFSLKIVENWCRAKGLEVNPDKTDIVLFSRRHTGQSRLGRFRLFGKDVTPGAKTKYLGVTLDRKLNWIEHVTDKSQKALTAFWTCRNSFGRNWGLPSKAILWIYEAVVRPMLTHGCVVWWPRVDIKCARKELSEVQRLVCICITGAMKTTATAAMETLMALPPIQTSVKSKAFASADRLRQNQLWVKNFKVGHGKIREVVTDQVFDMPRDRMIPKTNFVMNFETILPERSDWLVSWPKCLPVDGLVSFTDGSKTSVGTGAGIFIPEPMEEKWFHLGSFASTFQAETYAAAKGTKMMISPGEEGRTVTICSDSEAMIKALRSPVTTSKLVKEFKDTLNQLGLRNQIHLAWVPGHSGVEGNERADELANLGSASPPHGPEPIIPIPQSLCDRALRKWVQSESAASWRNYEGGAHTKRFFPVPDVKWARELISMDRNRIRRVVGAITGHCRLNKHLARMGIAADPNCTCGLEMETGFHIICECPRFSTLRLRTLGGHVVQPSAVPGLGPVALDRFLAGTGRFS